MNVLSNTKEQIIKGLEICQRTLYIIDNEYGGESKYSIPSTLIELENLIDNYIKKYKMEEEIMYTKENKIANSIVKEIEKDFTDRRGLRQEWESIDEEIKQDIRESWKNKTIKILEENK